MRFISINFNKFFIFIVAIIVTLLSFFSINRIFLLDSDVVNCYFEALDMAEGNIFLQGWHLPPDSFWLIDVAGMSALVRLLGPDANIPFILSAFWFAATVGFSVLLSIKSSEQWDWRRALPVILFMGFIPLFLRTSVSYVVYAPYHIGTIAISLLGLIFAQNIFSGKRYILSSFGLFIVSLFIFSSDFFGFAVFLCPLLFVGLLCFFKGELGRKSFYFIFVSVFCAWLFDRILKYCIVQHGGFTSAKLSTSFVPLEKIPEKAIYTVKSLLDFYGADFFGSWGQVFVFGLRLIPLLIIIGFYKVKISTYAEAKKFFFECDPVSQVVIVGAVIDFCAGFFSNFGVEKSDIVRYFFPFFVYSIILYARNAPKIHTLAFLVPCIVSGFIVFGIWRVWGNQEIRFVDIFHLGHQIDTREVNYVLLQHNLQYGYAGYWDASVTTVNSAGHQTVRALKNLKLFDEKHNEKPANECTFAPYLWLSKESWYHRSEFSGGKSIFFITHDGEDPNHAWIRHSDLVASLGEPNQHYVLHDGVGIDVYSRDKLDGCNGLFLED